VLADADRVNLLVKGRITAEGTYGDLEGKDLVPGPSPAGRE
jgi:hypothetical protein